MASFNTYISAKRVKRLPNNRERLAEGTLNTGIPWVAGVDPDHPALLVVTYTTTGEELMLRLDFPRLVESLVAAEAADADRWQPLHEGDREDWWGNSILSAHVQRHNEDLIQISYHRRDRAPIRDWRIGQRLKNQLAGPEWEGFELYPAESRMVDTVNEYHLWCVHRPLPFGFDYHDVATQDQIDEAQSGAVQRDDPYADTTEFDPDQDTHKPVRTPVWPEEAKSA